MSSYRVKIPGAGDDLRVASTHMEEITKICTQPENFARMVPLFFGTGFSRPISSILIGAEVTPTENPEVRHARFRTGIQLDDNARIEEMLPDLTTVPEDPQSAHDWLGIGANVVRTECAVDLSASTQFPSNEPIPKERWLSFVGASFGYAVAIGEHYANISGDQPAPPLAVGEITVGLPPSPPHVV